MDLPELGDVVPASPVAAKVSRWGRERWSRGAWTSMPLGSAPSNFASLTAPLSGGRVLLAGEHTCALLFGTVHGAIASGLRAAQALLGGPTVANASTFALFEFASICESANVTTAAE